MYCATKDWPRQVVEIVGSCITLSEVGARKQWGFVVGKRDIFPQLKQGTKTLSIPSQIRVYLHVSKQCRKSGKKLCLRKTELWSHILSEARHQHFPLKINVSWRYSGFGLCSINSENTEVIQTLHFVKYEPQIFLRFDCHQIFAQPTSFWDCNFRNSINMASYVVLCARLEMENVGNLKKRTTVGISLNTFFFQSDFFHFPLRKALLMLLILNQIF